MYTWGHILILFPVIPWSIFAFWATLWPTTEQNNYKLLDWSRWVLTIWFIHPMMSFLFNVVFEGFCCNLSETRHTKSNLLCHKVASAFQWLIDFGLAGVQCFFAVWGCILLSKLNETDSKWFKFSMILMDICLWILFLAYVGYFVCIFFVSTCCRNYGVVVDKDVGLCQRLILNFRHFNGISLLQNKNNKREYHEKPEKKMMEKSHEISVSSGKVKTYGRDNHGDRHAMAMPSKAERHLRQSNEVVYGFDAEASEDLPRIDSNQLVWAWQKVEDDYNYFGIPADSPLRDQVNSSTLDSMFAEIKEAPFYHIWSVIKKSEKDRGCGLCYGTILFFITAIVCVI